MSGSGMIGSQKEMTAVINNLKEARVLDKALHTLSLEESYSTKLLHLNNKLVKFQYGRLQTNVSKIKSHLAPDEIASLRTLELDGRFKPETPIVSSSTASKLSAAAKRLKLNNYRRTKSATPRLQKRKTVQEEITKGAEGEAEPAQRVASRMCNRMSRRPSIMSDHSEVAAILCQKIRPHTVAGVESDEIQRQGSISSRPNTAALLHKITSAQKARKHQNQQTSYSCHDVKAPLSSSGSRSSQAQINDVFGPSAYEIRRQRFLDQEHNMTRSLDFRKREFLGQTSRFVRESPAISEMRPDLTEQIIKSIDSMARRPGSASSRLRSRSGRSIVDRVDSALLKQFAEIKKTRYLRMDDDMMDLSGVNTLAKDQFGSTESWRNLGNKSRVSFASAAAL